MEPEIKRCLESTKSIQTAVKTTKIADQIIILNNFPEFANRQYRIWNMHPRPRTRIARRQKLPQKLIIGLHRAFTYPLDSRGDFSNRSPCKHAHTLYANIQMHLSIYYIYI